MKTQILIGDSLAMLKTLPSESVNTCVTSPPYFGLRDYGMDGQIGLEPTPDEFIARLVEVFREVRRVLRNDGTCWVNIGDSYSSSATGCLSAKPSQMTGGRATQAEATKRPSKLGFDGIKTKDLIGIPWTLAFALRADGWYLRQDIIWSKPNPMPESVTDRCTKSHEYIFLLSKSASYYYDNEAVKEPVTLSTVERLSQANLENQTGSDRVPGKTNGPMKAVGQRSARDSFKRDDSKRAEVFPGQTMGTHRPDRDESEWDIGKRNKRSVWTVATQPFKGWTQTSHRVHVELDAVDDDTERTTSPDCPLHGDFSVKATSVFCGGHAGPPESHISRTDVYLCQEQPTERAPIATNHEAGNAPGNLDSDRRSCFQIANESSNQNHKTGHVPSTIQPYITSAEIQPCIPRNLTELDLVDSVVRTCESNNEKGDLADDPALNTLDGIAHKPNEMDLFLACTCSYSKMITKSISHFATFPPALIEPCILAGCPPNGTVLDPFFGAGTTGLVADRLQRNCIGIELNPAYALMARNRINDESPLFADVA